MTASFLVYLLKSSVFLSVFYLFFLLVMRNTTFFRFNRMALLAGTAVCLLLPMLKLPVAGPAVFSDILSGAVVTADAPGAAAPRYVAAPQHWRPESWIMLAYWAGVAMAFGQALRSYGQLFRLLRRTPAEPLEGCRLHLTDEEMPSLSWMRSIVMSRSDHQHHPFILAHERAHVDRGHSIDILLFTALTAFQWFNPLVWMVRTELRLLHEYEADESVLNQGIDATQYQLLLVKKAVGEKRFLLANGFNHSRLKKRINMMQTFPMAAWKKLSLLLVLPLVAGVTWLFAGNGNGPVLPQEQDETVPYAEVETKPTFQGGDALAFSHWVNAHLQYPDEAKKAGAQGRVTLKFTVTKTGKIADVKVLRGCDPLLDAEALRVISASPDWTPGQNKGKPVNVTYIFPVIFQLR